MKEANLISYLYKSLINYETWKYYLNLQNVKTIYSINLLITQIIHSIDCCLQNTHKFRRKTYYLNVKIHPLVRNKYIKDKSEENIHGMIIYIPFFSIGIKITVSKSHICTLFCSNLLLRLLSDQTVAFENNTFQFNSYRFFGFRTKLHVQRSKLKWLLSI